MSKKYSASKFNKPIKAYVFDLVVRDQVNGKTRDAIWTNDLPQLVIKTNNVQRHIDVTLFLVEDFDKQFYKYMTNAVNTKNSFIL